MVNLATLLIYGALYVSFAAEGLFFQGTLAYSPVAAGAVGLPIALLLTFLSTPGPLLEPARAATVHDRRAVIMAGALIWLSLVPNDTAALERRPVGSRVARPADRRDRRGHAPLTLFGIGILVVAPLATALMGSVPVRNVGLASAINNAISRVGQPLGGRSSSSP